MNQNLVGNGENAAGCREDSGSSPAPRRRNGLPMERTSLSPEVHDRQSDSPLPDQYDMRLEAKQGDTCSRVIESSMRLRPSHVCLQMHGKGKRKLAPGQDVECGCYHDCDEWTLQSLCTQPDLLAYRLQTADPAHDLKRLLTTRNHYIDGEPSERTLVAHHCLSESRYQDSHFRQAVKFGYQQIHFAHQYIRGLEDYAWRVPYQQDWSVIPRAEPLGTLLSDSEIDSLERPLLRSWFLFVEEEIAYLSRQAALAETKIIEMTWDEAQFGDYREIEQLLRLRILCEDQVKEFCILE